MDKLKKLGGIAVDAATGIPVLSTAKVLVGSSPDENVDAADVAIALERAHRVPMLEWEVRDIQDKLSAIYDAKKTAVLSGCSIELLRLVREGKLDMVEIDEDPQLHNAILASVRGAMESASTRATRLLTRLAVVLRDDRSRLFRRMARVISDLSEDESVALEALGRHLGEDTNAENAVKAQASLNAFWGEHGDESGSLGRVVFIEWGQTAKVPTLCGETLRAIGDTIETYDVSFRRRGSDHLLAASPEMARVLHDIGRLSALAE